MKTKLVLASTAFITISALAAGVALRKGEVEIRGARVTTYYVVETNYVSARLAETVNGKTMRVEIGTPVTNFFCRVIRPDGRDKSYPDGSAEGPAVRRTVPFDTP